MFGYSQPRVSNRFVMRIGLNSKIRWNDRLNVSTRLQYGYLLGGDVHGVARTQFAAVSPTSPVMGLRGVNLGRNQFNVGLGERSTVRTGTAATRSC